MPLRLQVAKVHKEMNITIVDLVMHYDFVSLCRNYTFRRGFNDIIFILQLTIFITVKNANHGLKS